MFLNVGKVPRGTSTSNLFTFIDKKCCQVRTCRKLQWNRDQTASVVKEILLTFKVKNLTSLDERSLILNSVLPSRNTSWPLRISRTPCLVQVARIPYLFYEGEHVASVNKSPIQCTMLWCANFMGHFSNEALTEHKHLQLPSFYQGIYRPMCFNQLNHF